MAFEERLVLDKESKTNIIYDEHLVRYRLAAQLAAGKKVLDIACGSGYGAKILAEAGAEKVIAIDRDAEAIEAAKKEYAITHPAAHFNRGTPPEEGIAFKVGDATEIKEADESFDLVVSFETIEHLKNIEKYLAEIFRVLKKEGIVLISTPNREVFGQQNPYHLREFTRTEFEIILKKYFADVLILEQANGLASFIKASTGIKAEINFSPPAGGSGEPLYFIAVCGKGSVELPSLLLQNQISVNPAALNRLRNNPVMKFIDKIYSFLSS